MAERTLALHHEPGGHVHLVYVPRGHLLRTTATRREQPIPSYQGPALFKSFTKIITVYDATGAA